MEIQTQSLSWQNELAETIIAIERTALDRWAKGDPDGFLEISAPDVVYFDPFIEHKLEGRDALKRWYDGLRGKVQIDHYTIVDPVVRISGDVALLTFNFVSHGSEAAMRWNTTEVYQRLDSKWRIIHTHWSFAQPKLASS
jgi:ketosteroid isomerase-like protein